MIKWLDHFDFAKFVSDNSVSGSIKDKQGNVCENLFVFDGTTLFKFADAISQHTENEIWKKIKEHIP